MTRLALILLGLLVLGCASPVTNETSAAPVGEAQFRVVDLLPGYQLTEFRRGNGPDALSVIEVFQFRTARVTVQYTHPNAVMEWRATQLSGDRDRMEAWARELGLVGPVLDVQPVSHARLSGQGWLMTLAHGSGGVNCTVGQAHYALRGRTDPGGLPDTVVMAMFCHREPTIPGGIQRVFREIRLRTA